MKKAYTIVIMSSHQDSVRQFSIGYWSFRFLYFLCFILGVGALGGIGYGILAKTRLYAVHGENETFRGTIESQRSRLEYLGNDLNREMDEIRQMADMVRNWLGLDNEQGILGQGGDSFDLNASDGSEEKSSAYSAQSTVIPIRLDVWGRSPSDPVVRLRHELEPVYNEVKSRVKELNEQPSILPLQVPRESEKPAFWFSSGFGYRTHPLTKSRQFHNGLDISARRGTPVIASANGVVAQVAKDRLLGNMVRIRHESTGMETIYGHLQKPATGIRKRTKVKRFDVIGYVGDTGRSTAPHLHYGVRTPSGWKNPRNYLLDIQPKN